MATFIYFIRNYINIFATQISVFIFTFLRGILIARLLGPSGKGIFAILIALLSVLTLTAGFGLQSAITYYVGSRKFNLKSIFSTSIIFGLFSGLLISGLFLVLNYYFQFFNFPKINGFLFLAILILIGTPLILIRSYIIGIFQGLKEFNYFNLISLLPVFLFSIFLIFLFWNNGSSKEVLLLYLISIVITVFLGFILLMRKISFSFRFDKSFFRVAVEKGKRVYLAVVFSNLMHYLSIIIMNYFLSSREIGYFSVAQGLSSALLYIPSAATTIHFPLVSGMKNGMKRKEVTSRLSRHNVLLVILGAILLGAFGRHIISLFYGEEFNPAFFILLYLLPGAIFFSTQAPFTSYFYGIGYPRIVYIAPLFALLTITILNVILLPRIGVIGAALATTCAYLVHFLTILASYCKRTESSLKELFFLRKEEFSLKQFLKR
jgi:O-antigen/teichoic acid export membrane protein